MEDRNAHWESVGEHLVPPTENILVQQHDGKMYKRSTTEEALVVAGGGKKFQIDDRLDCGMSRGSVLASSPTRGPA